MDQQCTAPDGVTCSPTWMHALPDPGARRAGRGGFRSMAPNLDAMASRRLGTPGRFPIGIAAELTLGAVLLGLTALAGLSSSTAHGPTD